MACSCLGLATLEPLSQDQVRSGSPDNRSPTSASASFDGTGRAKGLRDLGYGVDESDELVNCPGLGGTVDVNGVVDAGRLPGVFGEPTLADTRTLSILIPKGAASR